jgi:hypothetical protein
MDRHAAFAAGRDGHAAREIAKILNDKADPTRIRARQSFSIGN